MNITTKYGLIWYSTIDPSCGVEPVLCMKNRGVWMKFQDWKSRDSPWKSSWPPKTRKISWKEFSPACQTSSELLFLAIKPEAPACCVLRWASKAWYLSETWLWNDPPRLAVLILWDEPQNPGSQEIIGRYCRYIQQKAILNCSAYKPHRNLFQINCQSTFFLLNSLCCAVQSQVSRW